MDRVTRGRLVGGLLATSSAAALLCGGAEPAAACYTGPFTGGFTNSGATACITVSNTSFTGALGNTGTISPGNGSGNTLKITNSTITGEVSNSGTISANVEGILVGGSVITNGILNAGGGTITAGGTAIILENDATFAGGIQNSGTISANTAIALVFVSNFSGGITNSATISAHNGIAMVFDSTFAGGLTNSGTISVTQQGLRIGGTTSAQAVSHFSGNISNSGTIAAATGIFLSGGTVTGTVTNSGSITGTIGIELTNGNTLVGQINDGGTISTSSFGIEVGPTSKIASAGPNAIRVFGPTFTGGISNAGTISATDSVVRIEGASFAGGITNSGMIAGNAPLYVLLVSTFAGGINNSGTLTGNATPIILANVSNFSGGISNSGTITSGLGRGSLVQSVSTFSGGFTNSGTIAGAAGVGFLDGDVFNGNISNSGGITGNSLTSAALILGNSSTFTGSVINSGSLSARDGIEALNISTFAGGISNSGGTITASRYGIDVSDITQYGGSAAGGVTNSGSISARTGIFITAVSTFAGGISNSGTITGAGEGIAVATNAGHGVTTFSGGISNSGTISVGAFGIQVFKASNFSGGISNSSQVTGGTVAIDVFGGSLFAGGITNSSGGTISGGNTGIVANGVSSFTGGIINTGTIAGASLGIDVTSVTHFGTSAAGGITNSGRISAGGTGIEVTGVSTFIGGITNTGTIIGAVGILVQTTPSVSVFDSGTIIGSSGTAISFAGGTNTLTLGPTWSITGQVIGAGSDTLQFAGNVTGTANLNLTQIDTQFTGFSDFAVVSGTWDVSGTDSHNWSVTDGTLEVGDAANPGTSIGGAVTVGSGGTLMGHGTIGGNVMNIAGGIVAPGGTIGTLTVGGNYTQGASSTLSIEVSPTAASKLLVGGSASLAGTLALVYDPGVYSKATYDILHAASVSGTFATVSGTAPAGVAQAISYSATDVDLVLTGTGTAAGAVVVAPTHDTVFTATGTAALDGAQQTNDTLLGELAHPQSSGGTQTSAAPPATQAMQLAFNGGTEQLSQVVQALPEAMQQLGGWFRGIGNFDHLSGTTAIPGLTSEAGGFLAGIDRPVMDHITAGIAAGYSHTDLSQGDGEKGTIDTPRLAFYGSDALGSWALDGDIGYGHNAIHATRVITAVGETASSNHLGNEIDAALQARTHLIASGVTITPAAGLQYAHLFETAFTETGASGFNLSVAKRNSDSLRPFIGASAEESFASGGGTMWTPEADLAYSHELFSTPPSLLAVGGGAFTVSGLAPSRDALTLGGSISAKLSDQFLVYAAYHATLPTGNTFAQTVEAGLTYKF